MAVKVVDASALAALVFGEPEAEAVVRRLRSASLAAPTLLWHEMASVCLKKMNKYPDQRAALRQAFDLALKLPISILTVDDGGALDLAEAKGITAYDAAYLWLAGHLKAKLVTLDARLLKLIKGI
jgi:predicted nucleic acid-binding protein